MNLSEFTGFWETVHASFGYDPTSARKIAAFNRTYERVSHVPAGALPHIISRIESLDSFPRNLGKAVLDGWRDWRSVNHERIRREEEESRTVCPHCMDGFIWASDGRPGEILYRCGHCSSTEEDHCGLTRQQIEARGLKIIHPAG